MMSFMKKNAFNFFYYAFFTIHLTDITEKKTMLSQLTLRFPRRLIASLKTAPQLKTRP